MLPVCSHSPRIGNRWYPRRDRVCADDDITRSFNDGLRPEVVAEGVYVVPEPAQTCVSGSTVNVGSRYHVPGPNPDERLISVDEAGVISYPHTDRRGSTIALARAGQAVATFKYGPNGETTDSPAGYPWRYTGQKIDAFSGLYHYKARVYSPTMGRFLQPDPAGFVDGPNLYAYVLDDPFNAVDPLGMKGVSFFYAGQPNFWRTGQLLERARGPIYFVAGHANPDSIHDNRRSPTADLAHILGADELASFLRSEVRPGDTIFLAACELGKATYGSELAAARKAYVWAPVGFVEYPSGPYSDQVLTVGVVYDNGVRDADSYWQLYDPSGKAVEGARVYRVDIPSDGRAPILTTRPPRPNPSRPAPDRREPPPDRSKPR